MGAQPEPDDQTARRLCDQNLENKTRHARAKQVKDYEEIEQAY